MAVQAQERNNSYIVGAFAASDGVGECSNGVRYRSSNRVEELFSLFSVALIVVVTIMVFDKLSFSFVMLVLLGL